MATLPRRSGVRRRPLTKAEYYALGEAGFFRGEKVELIEGQLVVHSPQGAEHSSRLDLVAQALERVFGSGYWVRRQYPVDFGQTTEPEPDCSVVLGEPRQYLTGHPTSAVLIVEVSDSTLSFDRRRKGGLYARAGVADYWVVNLRRRQVEVYRVPIADATRPYGHRYSSRQDFQLGSSITPLAVATASVAVDDFLA